MTNQSMDVIAKVLEQVEEQVDAQLSKLNEVEEDLDRLKERRLEALKKAQKQKQVCVNFVLDIFLFSVTHLFCFFVFFRNGCLKAMENTEKSQVRKTFSARSKKAKRLSAISIENQHSGRLRETKHPSVLRVKLPFRLHKIYLINTLQFVVQCYVATKIINVYFAPHCPNTDARS